MLLAQSMKFGGELGSSFRWRAQRIEQHRQVSIAANGIYELSRGRNVTKKSGIDLSRWNGLSGCWCSWSGPAQAFGKAKELAPRLIDRRRIPLVGFVGLAYVSVVEYARYGVRAHA